MTSKILITWHLNHVTSKILITWHLNHVTSKRKPVQVKTRCSSTLVLTSSTPTSPSTGRPHRPTPPWCYSHWLAPSAGSWSVSTWTTRRNTSRYNSYSPYWDVPVRSWKCRSAQLRGRLNGPWVIPQSPDLGSEFLEHSDTKLIDNTAGVTVR